jgi:hypothetical protein
MWPDLRFDLVGRTGFEPVTSSVSECRHFRLAECLCRRDLDIRQPDVLRLSGSFLH